MRTQPFSQVTPCPWQKQTLCKPSRVCLVENMPLLIQLNPVAVAWFARHNACAQTLGILSLRVQSPSSRPTSRGASFCSHAELIAMVVMLVWPLSLVYEFKHIRSSCCVQQDVPCLSIGGCQKLIIFSGAT